jgi:cholesterol transport system auxiliary component
LPTLIVEPPHAASGFDNSRIIYIREPHRLEYFAHSEWVDPPARMIAPLIVAAVEGSGAFSAVVDAAGAAAADIRLTTEILRLQQDFGSSPSRVRFTLRATLVDSVKRRVIAVREFDASVAAASDDTVGGVAAANLAVDQVLQALAAFCAAAAREPLNASPQCPSCGDNAGK